MICHSVPALLEHLRMLSPEIRVKLVAFFDEQTLNLGFRLGGETYEIPISIWSEHYGYRPPHLGSNLDRRYRAEAMAKWRADLRKISVPLIEETEIAGMVSEGAHRALPTAWARVLEEEGSDD